MAGRIDPPFLNAEPLRRPVQLNSKVNWWYSRGREGDRHRDEQCAAGLVASDFVPVVAENPAGSGATAIEIEIGGATLRVGAGIELGFLGKVLRLLRAMK